MIHTRAICIFLINYDRIISLTYNYIACDLFNKATCSINILLSTLVFRNRIVSFSLKYNILNFI